MTPLSIARLNLVMLLRSRTNAFFLVLFPMLMITVLGLAFGGEFEPRVAVVAREPAHLARALVDELERTGGFSLHRYDGRGEAIAAVEEGVMEAAVLVPGDYDRSLTAGDPVAVGYVSRSDTHAQQIGMIVRAAVDRQAALVKVANVLGSQFGGDLSARVEQARQAWSSVAHVSVETSTVGAGASSQSSGRFDLGASSQLLLFTFITSMTGASALIETRRLGIARRVFSTPNTVRSIVLGEALGRVAIAIVQGLIIMLGAALIFGVSWGEPIGAVLLMITFATVAGGAGMLLGSTASTSEQSIALGLLAGLGLAALGGSMMPLEFFSPTMLTIAHFTPHAWAADGFASLVRHNGTVMTILPELGVLAGFAVALFTAGSWALRRRLLHG